MEIKKPGLFVSEEPDGRIHKILIEEDGSVALNETFSPHDDLLRLMRWRVAGYRKCIKELCAHPLFQEALDVSVLDHQDFLEQCFVIADSFEGVFPEAHFFTRAALEDLFIDRFDDDGSASFLLYHGRKMLDAVREPYFTYVRMRNIMEVCFGTTDGMTQQERRERIETIYPQLKEYDCWMTLNTNEVHSLMELYVYELNLVLRSKRRIARCKNCWQYFVPKTNKKTDYCDRIWRDGQSCKQMGSNLKRKDAPAEDEYLLAFKRLRARFYEREYRAYAGLQSMEVPYGGYFNWTDMASDARAAYLDGEISGEELLRRINPENEPIDMAIAENNANETLFAPWEQLVERSMEFDPEQSFENVQFLDLGAPAPKWKIITAEEQIRNARHGNISLREKYRKQK